MITRQFLNSGDRVSFLWPEVRDGALSWTAVHGIAERVFPNGDFVVVDEKGLSPMRFAYAAMDKARSLCVMAKAVANPLHRYTIDELWEGDD